jgi:hypothetical protein
MYNAKTCYNSIVPNTFGDKPFLMLFNAPPPHSAIEEIPNALARQPCLNCNECGDALPHRDLDVVLVDVAHKTLLTFCQGCGPVVVVGLDPDIDPPQSPQPTLH